MHLFSTVNKCKTPKRMRSKKVQPQQEKFFRGSFASTGKTPAEN